MGDSTVVTGAVMEVSMGIVAPTDKHSTKGGMQGRQVERKFLGRSDWSCQVGKGEWEGDKNIPGRGHSRCKDTKASFVCALLCLAWVRVGGGGRRLGRESLEELGANKLRGI